MPDTKQHLTTQIPSAQDPTRTRIKVRIFVASPGDVLEERNRLARVVEELNRGLADKLRLTLELLRWETHVTPDVGIPQRVIFQKSPPEDWDIFVGILWHRFGSETGEIDPETHQLYWSGTEQEFKAAYRLRQTSATGWPKVMFYRCIRSPDNILGVDLKQLASVTQFFAEFAPSGSHPGLVQDYQQPEEFERLVRRHLEEWLWEFAKGLPREDQGPMEAEAQSLSAGEAQSPAPSPTPIPSCRLSQMPLPELRQLMFKHLTIEQVKTLYFDLGEGRVLISDDDEKNDKITNLLDKLGKYKPSRIPEMIDWICRNRPDLCRHSQENLEQPSSIPQILPPEGGATAMDPQTASLLATIGAWLWSFIAPGAKGFVEGVGKGMGEGFAKLTWGMLAKARQIDSRQAALVDQSPSTSANQSIARNLILQAVQQDPSVVPQPAVGKIKIAFKKLLKNPAFFDDSDIRHQLVPNLGYTVAELAGPSASTSDLANMLVDKVVADSRLEDLIHEIQELKPHLFRCVDHQM